MASCCCLAPVRATIRSSAAEEDLGRFANGPLETPLPRFHRGPSQQLKPASAPAKDRSRVWRPQRRYKATPQQAIAGSVIGGACSVASMNALLAMYSHVAANPLAHDVPFGLTDDVNQAVLTMLLGFGWLGVSMFGVSSIGLAMLAGKLLSTPSSSDPR